MASEATNATTGPKMSRFVLRLTPEDRDQIEQCIMLMRAVNGVYGTRDEVGDGESIADICGEWHAAKLAEFAAKRGA